MGKHPNTYTQAMSDWGWTDPLVTLVSALFGGAVTYAATYDPYRRLRQTLEIYDALPERISAAWMPEVLEAYHKVGTFPRKAWVFIAYLLPAGAWVGFQIVTADSWARWISIGTAVAMAFVVFRWARSMGSLTKKNQDARLTRLTDELARQEALLNGAPGASHTSNPQP